MRAHVLFVNLLKPLPDVVGTLQKELKGGFVVVRPELAVLPRLLEYGYFAAFKRIENGTASANNLNMEWLCRIAGDSHVNQASAFCKPAGSFAAIVTVEELTDANLKALAAVAQPVELTDAELIQWRKKAAKLYGFESAALELYSVEELAIAKSAASLA